MQDDIREIVEETYTISQEAIQKISPTFNLVDYRAMDWLEETNIYWIGKHYDSQVVDRLKKAGYQVIEDGLARDEAGKVLKELFTDQFKKSNSYWEGLSNHIVTQSREFGAIEAYVKAEVTQYRIDAVLDDRTSDICRYLDGTIYEVSKAVEMRDRVMSAATPEASIKIKKWIPYDAKKDDPPDKDLPDFAFPPYHFNCRSRSVSV
jgi:SPP1 gp7 family putative phage head morphogenesis protein